MQLTAILVYVCLPDIVFAWFYGRPDPDAMTFGEAWPLPQHQTWGEFNHTLNSADFVFEAYEGCGSDVLTAAMTSYKKWTFPQPSASEASTLGKLTIRILNNPAEVGYPQMGMNESYTLTVTETNATLTAEEVWGALRGLETFSQLVYMSSDGNYTIHETTVVDFPRFPHRGVMLDSARHFLSVKVIKRNIDLIAQNKMNVLHWHLVDSEAFPYASAKYPELSEKGAYTLNHRYSVEQQKDIVEYARLRGVRVVPEFDTPGHMGAWGAGFPGLLADCFNLDGTKRELSNIFDPTNETNFNFLKDFFTEALGLFPDNFMHFGGDEVRGDMIACWERNPAVQEYMAAHNYTSTQLLNYYFQRLFELVNEARPKVGTLVWQEVLDNKVEAPNAIAHVWKGGNYEGIMQTMANVTAMGHRAILSSCWYLNFIKYGPDWGYLDQPGLMERGMYYQCNPTGFDGNDEQKKLVLGGEATMWAEFVDGTNLLPRLWPRASAVAERLWSDMESTKSADAAWPRLHEHRCRMMNRGYRVQPPNNPDFCPNYWDPDYPDLKL